MPVLGVLGLRRSEGRLGTDVAHPHINVPTRKLEAPINIANLRTGSRFPNTADKTEI